MQYVSNNLKDKKNHQVEVIELFCQACNSLCIIQGFKEFSITAY